MKKLIEKTNNESAVWNYKGYVLLKMNNYWYATKEGVLYVANGEPSDTMQELKEAIDENNIYQW